MKSPNQRGKETVPRRNTDAEVEDTATQNVKEYSHMYVKSGVPNLDGTQINETSDEGRHNYNCEMNLVLPHLRIS